MHTHPMIRDGGKKASPVVSQPTSPILPKLISQLMKSKIGAWVTAANGRWRGNAWAPT